MAACIRACFLLIFSFRFGVYLFAYFCLVSVVIFNLCFTVQRNASFPAKYSTRTLKLLILTLLRKHSTATPYSKLSKDRHDFL